MVDVDLATSVRPAATAAPCTGQTAATGLVWSQDGTTLAVTA
jgi:hypothetical protein